jgi:RNA polymerase primary sigma factor
MSLENRQSALNKVLKISDKKGYVTENDISDVADDYSLSIVDYDWLTNEIFTRNILVTDDKGIIDNSDDSNELTDDYTDYAHFDYEKIYQKIESLYPQLSTFINEIRCIKPAQRREFQELINHAQNGNEYARERIIKMNLRQVLSVALNYSEKYDADFQDCLQDGIIGLMMAVENYDNRKGGAFLSYAKWYMLSRIERYQYINTPIRIPSLLLQSYDNVLKYLKDQGISIDKDILNDDELKKTIAIKFELSKEIVNNIFILICPYKSLEEAALEYCYVNDYKVYKYGAFEKDIPHEFTINNSFDNEEEWRSLLNWALGKLKPRSRKIVEMRYGMIDGEFHTLEEVGTAIGVTRERIRQIEAKSLKKLRIIINKRLNSSQVKEQNYNRLNSSTGKQLKIQNARGVQTENKDINPYEMMSGKKFYLNKGNIKAIGQVKQNGFLLLKGSLISSKRYSNLSDSCYEDKLDTYVNKDYVLQVDIPFRDVSAAASFVLGRNSLGRTVWKDEKGKTFKMNMTDCAAKLKINSD